ncbi:MAG: aminomethyltransferase, partial [Woeseiaceae bacterium]|nr:aminomethyltransferase [Woeseiaceae bacterium]
VAAVRRGVGLIDVSTLGGIDVYGVDAAEFLNRIYTFAYKKQKPGTLRYALMTNEAGVVIDDGVVCRLNEDRFYVTATTGGVDGVFRKMLQWNAEWQLDVTLVNVTSAYSAVNIAGPSARDVLQSLCDGIQLDKDAFPYLGVRQGRIAGIPAMLLRVGFVGELGFEIHVPSHCGEALWDALMNAGQAYGVRPVGVEAQRMLRLEKGHVIVGQDTDAMSTPSELQMDWAIAKTKPFFVGGRSLKVLQQKPAHRKLVGFSCDAGVALPREGHLVVENEQMLGRVTSCGMSHMLGRIVGLAYVPTQLAEPGSRIHIGVDNGIVDAVVEALPFYDPDGKRQEC